MIGSIISGVAGLAGGLFGGIKAGKASKKAQQAMEGERQYNNALFNKEYYSNAMDRSDNAALMNNLRLLLKDQTNRSAATAAVTGATPEAQLAQRAAANDTLAKAAGNISSMNSQYKDNVMNRYLNQRQNLYNQQQSALGQEAQGWTNMMQNGLNTAISGASSIAGSLLNKRSNKEA